MNKVLKKYTNKCFVLSNVDRPVTIYRGLYGSAEKSFFNFGRIRSCSYTDVHEPFKNSFIAQHNFNDVLPKEYLFSFIGRNCHESRRRIFEKEFIRKDIFIEDSTEIFNLYEKETRVLAREKFYYETLLKSKFSLCPRGWGATSYRLFESMQLGVAPVIISDEWVFPKGPKWDQFSIIIKTRELPQLEQIIADKEDRYKEMGKLAKFNFDEFFSDKKYFTYIIENCLELKSKQLIPELFYYHLNPALLFFFKAKTKFKNILGRFQTT